MYVCINFTVDAATNLCSWFVPQPVGPTALHCNIWLPISLPAEPGDREGLTAWACGRSLAGTVGSNPARGMDVYFLRVLCVAK